MEDIKKAERNVETETKKHVRDLDGHDLGDDVGNAGDEIRKDLGNAGDDIRKGLGHAGDEVRDGVRDWQRDDTVRTPR